MGIFDVVSHAMEVVVVVVPVVVVAVAVVPLEGTPCGDSVSMPIGSLIGAATGAATLLDYLL